MEKSCIWNFKIIKEHELPETWIDFCDMFPKCGNSFYIDESSVINEVKQSKEIRFIEEDKNILPDRDTAEAVLALCQLIQLRNCYNGDWKPSYEEDNAYFFIDFIDKKASTGFACRSASILYFKNREIRDEFMRNFRPLIEKLMPLYGIKEGGEQ